jgi:hypothetical protein
VNHKVKHIGPEGLAIPVEHISAPKKKINEQLSVWAAPVWNVNSQYILVKSPLHESPQKPSCNGEAESVSRQYKRRQARASLRTPNL